MQEMFDAGYAEEVVGADSAQRDGYVNYIPHHAVTHPRKTGKLRVVYDCAAKYGGVSLNDSIYQGPDWFCSGQLCDVQPGKSE